MDVDGHSKGEGSGVGFKYLDTLLYVAVDLKVDLFVL